MIKQSMKPQDYSSIPIYCDLPAPQFMAIYPISNHINLLWPPIILKKSAHSPCLFTPPSNNYGSENVWSKIAIASYELVSYTLFLYKKPSGHDQKFWLKCFLTCFLSPVSRKMGWWHQGVKNRWINKYMNHTVSRRGRVLYEVTK